MNATRVLRSLYVKVENGNVAGAIMKMQAKVTAGGIDKELQSRLRYIKPKYQRQKAERSKVFAIARRARDEYVRGVAGDAAACPF